MNECTDQVFKGPEASYLLRFENGSLIWSAPGADSPLNRSTGPQATPGSLASGLVQRWHLARFEDAKGAPRQGGEIYSEESNLSLKA